MSDKIGMNHTHIDFHKGTHGYPIKNADDMMKPCPLMPDGKWGKITVRLNYDADTTTRTCEIIYNSFAEHGMGCFVGSASLINVGDIWTSTTENKNCWIGLPHTSGYVFGEVRCSYNSEYASVNNDIYVQNTNGWLVGKSRQQYCIFNDISWDRMSSGKDLYIDTYPYIMPYTDYNETGDE